MTTLCLSAYHTSFEWPHIPCLLIEGDIVVGNQFKNKVDCVLSINNYHMTHCVDFKVSIFDKKIYQISCSNAPCKFLLLVSYRKRIDLWEIGIMNFPHSCSTTILNLDHLKLSFQLMFQCLMPLVDKDPSTKVSSCINQIVYKYKFTLSYRQAWITRNKAIE